VVRAGETLWRVAEKTLGDGKRWREILELNPTAIPAPDRLVGGTKLIIPARSPRAAVNPTARPAPVDTGRSAIPPTRAERSVFYQDRPGGVGSRLLGTDSLGKGGRAVNDSIRPAPTVRAWEYVSAPFVVDAPMLDRAGRCLSIDAGSQGSAHGATSTVRFGDRIRLRPPDGVPTIVDTRLLVARPGPMLGDLGRLVTPTGIARITQPASANASAVAQIVAQFDTLSCGDLLLRLEVPRTTLEAKPAAVSSGPAGSVVWVASTAVLPSLQHRVIIDLGAAAGLKPGDQVTLFSPARMDSGGTGADRVALATVLRVGSRASSALIVRQARAGISIGTPVRVTAKLP
jgi:hypothetical protein